MSLILYMLLGGVLAFSGVDVMDKPFHFIAIMVIVVLIDTVGRNR